MRYLFTILLMVSTTSSIGQPAEAEKVNRLHRQKFQWLINKNYDSLNQVLQDQVQYIHSSGWVQSKAEVVDDLKSGRLVYSTVHVAESSVRMFQNTAIVTGKGTFTGLMPDQSQFNINLLYTEVYVKEKKQWKLVNRQAVRLVN
jgi:hypothetical protein